MALTPTDAAKEAVRRLKGTWHGSYGKARCPAHQDSSPSLSISPGRKAVLFKCFAGCPQDAILAALKSHGPIERPTSIDDRPLERRDLTGLVRQLWDKALPLAGTPAERYLESRRILHSTIGRYAPSAVTYENQQRLRSRALFLPVIERDEIVALARVFIDREGRKNADLAEPKRTLGDPRGGAVQIGRIENDHLNLAEGFEDAESAIAMRGLPGCWAVNGTEQYARLYIPPHIKSIAIYSQHGVAAAAGIAKAEPHLTAAGRSLRIHLPPPRGDWNDAWRAAA